MITLADKVYDKLEKDILSGVYKPGQLLTELSLIDALGVSRTPVREALRRLEQEHIIEATGKGMVVLGITSADIDAIYEIRSRIEGLAAAECAKNASDEQIAELKDLIELQEFYVEKHDSEKVKAMDSSFHEKIYKYTGSNVYYDTLMPLHRKIQKVRKQSVEDEARAGDSVLEHEKILEAITNHDPDSAYQATFDHIKRTREHLREINILEE